MKNIFKDAVILFAITIVAGLLLGFVYEGTKEARENQALIKKNNAYKTVFYDYYSKLEDYSDANFDEIVYEKIDVTSLKKLNENLQKAGLSDNVVIIDEAISAKLGRSMLGYAITVTSKQGYGGDIQFTVGIALDGKVTGISYLSIGETAGLGMKAKENAFIDRYVGKAGGNFVVDKDNLSGVKNEIDALSGATITSRAVTKGVNAAYITTATILNGGDDNE